VQRLGPIVAIAVLAPNSAEAFSYLSTVSADCHERITLEALRSVRAELGMSITESDESVHAMMDDLPFDIEEDLADLPAAALVIGVRYNDLKGRGPADIDQLAMIHGDPDAQQEHCLRKPDQDEPNGSEAALVQCRTFIEEAFLAALEGIGPDQRPDPARTISVPHVLLLRGRVESELPRFWFNLGRAIHTLQDSYSHTYRTPDGSRVTAALNWVDFVEHELEEPRDGPQHIADLDDCEASGPIHEVRRSRATTATIELLRLALDEEKDERAKIAGLRAILADHTSLEPGCTFENGWCGAKEAELAEGLLCGCRETSGRSGAPIGILLVFLFLIARRRSAIAIAIACVVLSASPVRAEDETQAETEKDSEQEKESTVEVIPGTGLMLHLAGGASFDEPAIAAIAAGRYRLSDRWLFGADLEWNPWVTPSPRRFRAGAINFYGTVIRQWPMKREEVKLRSTVNVGTSVLLIDLVGAPSGHVGFLFGFSVLGVEWQISEGWYMVFDPAHLMIPIPQITGAPFGYVQYRFTLGIQFGG
jgi:hypothetical protein